MKVLTVGQSVHECRNGLQSSRKNQSPRSNQNLIERMDCLSQVLQQGFGAYFDALKASHPGSLYRHP